MKRAGAMVSSAVMASRALSSAALSVTGMPAGPFAVGVTTLQLDDHARTDPESGGPRRLQTEIWYPADPAETAGLPRNKYSEFLGRGCIPGSLAAAEAPDAIGGYREGLTIAELDATWPNAAVRDARPCGRCAAPWPLVVFSHGSGAFRASYVYWTELLASHGFVVAACDHLGSARYTQVNGAVVTPGGARSTKAQMEADRPADVRFVLDAVARLAAGADSRFAGRVDASRCALTGMSFGGWATAAALELGADPRVKCAILQCPSLAMSGRAKLADARADRATPVMVMLGTEDTVIGAAGNEAGRQYARGHEGPSYLVEIARGGHVSFTSCELYNAEYGNGIGTSCDSLTAPGEKYAPLPIAKQHEIINSYALAFLNTHLRPDPGAPGRAASAAEFNEEYLTKSHFGDEVVFESNR